MTSVVIRLIIARDKLKGKIDWLGHFSRCMNPEFWADVAPDYFKGSAVVPDPKRNRSASLEGWSGQLHEKVTWAVNDAFTSLVENRLDVDFSVNRSTQELRLTYSLAESISSEVAGSEQSGGLDVDDGEVMMWPSADGAYLNVIATKQVRFVNRDAPPLPGGVNLGEFLNFMAPASVGLWMDSLVFQTALGAIRDALGPQAAAARQKDQLLGDPPAAIPPVRRPQNRQHRRGSNVRRSSVTL